MEIDGNCTLAQCGCCPVDIEALDAGGTVKEAWKANKQSDASKLLVDPSTERRRMVSVLMKLPADLLSMPFFDPRSLTQEDPCSGADAETSAVSWGPRRSMENGDWFGKYPRVSIQSLLIRSDLLQPLGEGKLHSRL